MFRFPFHSLIAGKLESFSLAIGLFERCQEEVRRNFSPTRWWHAGIQQRQGAAGYSRFVIPEFISNCDGSNEDCWRPYYGKIGVEKLPVRAQEKVICKRLVGHFSNIPGAYIYFRKALINSFPFHTSSTEFFKALRSLCRPFPANIGKGSVH